MKIIAGLHIHSRYSRATSKDMEVGTPGCFGEIKGINLIGTGDFTHLRYFTELKQRRKVLSRGIILTGSRS